MFEEIFADLAKDPKEHAETVFKEVPGKEKPLFGSEEWFCFLVDSQHILCKSVHTELGTKEFRP